LGPKNLFHQDGRSSSYRQLPVEALVRRGSEIHLYCLCMRHICFISDYGLANELVGSCKGVMASIAPKAPIIDITHAVPAFDVIRGAELLQHATRYMPKDAVYLAVVDPGDKTERRALAAQVQSGAYFVGPDNGLLLPAAEALGGIRRAVDLTNQRYYVKPVSNSFHGRDIFSPVAAHLAAGTDLDNLGEEVEPKSMETIDFPEVEREAGGGLVAEIIDIDHFGNARLAAMQDDLDLPYGASLRLGIRDEVLDARYVEAFGASKAGDLVLVADSHWRLSLGVTKGNASRALLLEVGEKVRIEASGQSSS
jgi:S-adenosylmethionine hydrolase